MKTLFSTGQHSLYTLCGGRDFEEQCGALSSAKSAHHGHDAQLTRCTTKSVLNFLNTALILCTLLSTIAPRIIAPLYCMLCTVLSQLDWCSGVHCLIDRTILNTTNTTSILY